ncbi:DUF397 domain-containing protein [Embleya sp. AB8]|uniref:DUF397 domain-containing protein n=1 Tax=Embleya sp. AB8 TaxID=3156304 RepID=UPI003C78C98F
MSMPSHWRKSSYSASNQECVEIALFSAATVVRDTKDRERGHLTMPPKAWVALLGTVKSAR